MIAAVNLGGDADSIGAVYGQIAGAYYGYSAIPERWLAAVKDREKINQLITDFLAVTGNENSGKIDMATLEGGNVLRLLVKQMYDKPCKKHYVAVLHCLRDSFIWIPCTVEMSDADMQKFRHAHTGDEIQTSDGARFVPDTLQKDDKFFFPVFSNVEQMGEYGKNFSKLEKHFFVAMSETLKKENLCGVVLDAFTAPFVVPKEDFGFLGELPSMLRMDDDPSSEGTPFEEDHKTRKGF